VAPDTDERFTYSYVGEIEGTDALIGVAIEATGTTVTIYLCDVAGAVVVAGAGAVVLVGVTGGAVVAGAHGVAAEVCPAPASTATPTAKATTTTGSTACRRHRTATTSNAPTVINASATRTSDVVDDPVAGRVEHSFIAAPPVRHPPRRCAW